MGNWKQEPQSLLPTAEPTRDDVLFFAGFYEGEGSACGHKTGGTIVQVPQKDPEVLYRARSLWGGSIRQPSGRDVRVWVLTGDRARRFLQAIYPHLSSRRKEQIERAGGLQFSGKKQAEVGGLTPERKKSRAVMTDAERHTDSCMQWARKNPEKARDINMRYAEKNRERINARQRERRRRISEQQFSTRNEIQSERNLLVN